MSLKEKILKEIKNAYNEELYMLDLKDLIPELKGKYDYVKGAKEWSVKTAFIGGVSKEAIGILDELIFIEKKLEPTPLNVYDLMFDGLGIWQDYPIWEPGYLKNKKILNSKKTYWTPLKLKYINK